MPGSSSSRIDSICSTPMTSTRLSLPLTSRFWIWGYSPIIRPQFSHISLKTILILLSGHSGKQFLKLIRARLLTDRCGPKFRAIKPISPDAMSIGNNLSVLTITQARTPSSGQVKNFLNHFVFKYCDLLLLAIFK